MSNQQSLYDRDFYAWARHNAALLRAGRIAEADSEHLAEVWPRARRQACDALPAFGERVQIPEVCPYSSEQALDDGFFPVGPTARR